MNRNYCAYLVSVPIDDFRRMESRSERYDDLTKTIKNLKVDLSTASKEDLGKAMHVILSWVKAYDY